MSATDDRRSGPNRRMLMKLLGGASTLAAAGGAGATNAHAYDPGDRETKARYRETEHVKAYYRTNRYEGIKKPL